MKGEPDRALEGLPEWELVQRIASSSGFARSPRLTALLLHLAGRKLQGRLDELTETLVAIHVFGRPTDYNPAEDSIVRTHARLLRQKLETYFQGEGGREELILEVPKGGYVPVFSSRRVQAAPSSPVTLPASNKRWKLTAAAVAVIAAVFLGGIWIGGQWRRGAAAAAGNPSDVVNQFWKGVLGKDESIIISYTNSVFLATEIGDLLRFSGGAVADRGALVGTQDSSMSALNPGLAAKAGSLHYEDGFTGTGEVLAVNDLTQVFTNLGIQVAIKRSRLLTVDDLKNHDLVFLGSPFDTQLLAETHFARRFIFEWPQKAPYLWNGAIEDAAGGPSGRAYHVERDAHSGVIRADHAVFDVVPGLRPPRRIVILAGLTTSGTQGAAECATTQAGLLQILEGLGTQRAGSRAFPSFFESLLRVEAAKGLDVVNVKYVSGTAVQPTQ